MVKLNGRKLKPPTLNYGDDKTAPISGSHWSLKDVPFRTPKELDNWACLRIYHGNDESSIHKDPLKKSLKDFQDHLEAKGIKAKKNNYHDDLWLPKNDYGPLEQWFRESRNTYRVRFLLVVLPKVPTSELYNHIKRCGDIINGIHTVCVTTKGFGTLPYDDNVALVSTKLFPCR